MAVTVTPDLTLIYDAESEVNWSSPQDSPSLVSGFQREGSNCLGFQLSQEAGEATKSITSTDLSNTRIYSWVRLHISVDTKANGGIRIVLGDGTNTVAYHVGGNDDFGFQFGVWLCMVMDTANTPTGFTTLAGSEASLDFTAITEIGVGFNTTIKAQGNINNLFWDVCRHGTGLTITGGSDADPGTFAEIVTEDESTTNAWGIIRELQAGVYGIQGTLTFGDNSGTGSVHFEDKDSVVVIEDHIHGSGTPSAIDINVVSNTTGTTHFEMGVAVGSGDNESGSNGVQFRNANLSQTASFNASDANVEDVLLFGVTILGFGQGITFSADTTNGPTHRLSGTTCNQSGQVDLGRVVTRNCNFSGYDLAADAALLWNDNIDIKNSKFFANTNGTDAAAIEHPSNVNSPFTYDNLTFSGNDFDINNTSGGAITIDAVNGSDPSTSKGFSVTINNAINLNITVKDNAGNSIQNAQTAIYREDDGTELMNEDTDVNGLATETFNFPGSDVPVTVRVRKGSSEDGTKYKPVNSPQTITASGLDIVITLQEDTINTA